MSPSPATSFWRCIPGCGRRRACARTSASVQYIEAWLRGRGAVPLYNLMEDAATAEISRAQVWQWLYHGADLDDGRIVTPALFRQVMDDEMKRVGSPSAHKSTTRGTSRRR